MNENSLKFNGRRELRRKITEEIAQDWSLITLIEQKPWMCVQILVGLRGEIYTGTGFSKVRYPDRWDFDAGKNIAVSKALRNAADKIIDEAVAQGTLTRLVNMLCP
jgi:hypothetical protein